MRKATKNSLIAHFFCTFWHQLGINWHQLWHQVAFFAVFDDASERQLVHLCACRNVRIQHEKMELFLAVFMVDRGDQHATGVDAHHLARGQIGDGNTGLTDKLFRLIKLMNTTQNNAIFSTSIV